MIQRQFAKTLDGVSMLYMSLKKKRRSEQFYPEGLDGFINGIENLDPAVFFKNHDVTPEITMTKTSGRRGYSIKYFHFQSCLETPHPRNNIVHGRLYEITGKPSAPTMIVLHGWRMENYAFFDYYCRLLVRSGFNAILIDLPYHMHRRPANSFHGEFTFSDDVVLTIQVIRQGISDIQSTINHLKSQGVSKIGIFGVSYGAMLAGIAGCVEPLTDFMMLVAPPADLYDTLTDSNLGRKLEQWNPEMSSGMKDHKDLVKAISLTNLKPLMPRERVFLVMAEYDGMICNDSIERLWLAWDRPYMERYQHGHLSVILFNPSMNRDMRRWLKTIQAESAV